MHMVSYKRIQKMSQFFLTALVVLLLMATSASAMMVDSLRVYAAPLSLDTDATNGMVRVYLSSLGNPSTLHLTTKGNYSVNGTFLPSGTQLTVRFQSATGKITLSYNGQSWDMGKSFSLRRHSASGTNGILIAEARESGNPYPGDLSFKAVSGGSGYTLYTVAHIYIENYLYGVLPYEMGNSSNIEALKAQAVAARTYTVRMMKNRASGLYDVKDTTSDQVYRGTPGGNANCVAAVDATKGIVLMYGSSYITTYYSASNGGQTEASRSGGNYAYMKVKDDPFDYANPSSTVKSRTIYADLSHSGNPAQLLSLLKNKAVSKLNQMGYAADYSNTTLQTLRSITPHTPMYASPSRLYTKMDFSIVMTTRNASGQTVTVTQSVTCDIFDELESILGLGIQSSDNELWSVEKSDGQFKVQSRRYGHGMGMSQRGAMYMGKLGYNYAQILGFYYDGCERVQHSFTNTILSADSSDEQTKIEDPAEMEDNNVSSCKGTVKLVSSGSSLAIRSTKSASGDVIGTAGNGAIVDVLSTDGSWCMIRFGELCGYVPKNALEITGTPDQEEGAVSNIIGFAKVTANDFVNLRAQANMSGKVLGTAPTGSILTVFEKNGSWARVQHHSLVAYVNTNYISSITADYPAEDLSSGTVLARVYADEGSSLLLQSPSTTASILKTISNGAIVTVRSDDGSWSEVEYEGIRGYMLSAELLAADEEPPVSDEETSDENEPEEDNTQPDDEDAETNESESTALTAVVTTEYGSLNMRAEARAGSFILTTIPRGMQIRVFERGDEWSLVEYAGYTGYVMNTFLTFAGFGDGPETDEETDPDWETATAMVVTPSGSLNMRSEPRTGSMILTRIQPYELVTVLERGSEWCLISYRNMTGYVMTVFLSLSEYDVSEPDEPEVPEKPEEEENEEIVEPPVHNGQYALVSTASGSLNLRYAPVSGSAVIARIPKGMMLVIEEKLSAWSRTSYAGQTGYVSNIYLSFLNDSPPATDGETAIVTTPSGSLNLRAQPSRNAQIVLTIPRYATVQVQQNEGEWCCVAYLGQLGYVMTEYLTFDLTAPSVPENKPEDEPESEARFAVVATDSGSLNLREYPASGQRVLTTIPKGTRIEVVEYGDNWCAVYYGGYSGYVMTSFLRFEMDEEAEDDPDDDTGDYDESTAVSVWVNVESGSLNLRQSPVRDAHVLASIPRGAQVKLLEEGTQWSFVCYEQQYGYVMTEYLSADKPEDNHGPSDTQTPAEDETGEEIVQSGEMMLDVTLEMPDEAVFAQNATDGSIKLWSMCAQTGEPVGRVQAGQQVEIILLGETWCLVSCDDVQGYCYTHLLSVIE